MLGLKLGWMDRRDEVTLVDAGQSCLGHPNGLRHHWGTQRLPFQIEILYLWSC